MPGLFGLHTVGKTSLTDNCIASFNRQTLSSSCAGCDGEFASLCFNLSLNAARAIVLQSASMFLLGSCRCFLDVLFSLSFSLHITKLWSVEMSAPWNVLQTRTAVLHLLSNSTKSIMLVYLPSGAIHIHLLLESGVGDQ